MCSYLVLRNIFKVKMAAIDKDKLFFTIMLAYTNQLPFVSKAFRKLF